MSDGFFNVYIPTLDEHGFTTLSSVSVGLAVLLVPVFYYLLQRRSFTTKSANGDPGKVSVDVPQFDIASVRVSKILIHPIKSCKGSPVTEARYTTAGLENDRKWCVIREDTHVVVTAREVSQMVLIRPRVIADESDPDGGRLEVIFPEGSNGETFSVPLNPSRQTLQRWHSLDTVGLWSQSDVDGYICQCADGKSPSAIMSRYIGYPVYLVMKGTRPRPCQPTLRFPKLEASSHYQDGYPLMVMSEESVESIQAKVRSMIGFQGIDEKWANEKLVIERFRPNIVFKGARLPFIEDMLAEFTIDPHPEPERSTAPLIRLVSKCTRCLLPNVDTNTGIRDKAVPFKVLMKHRKGLDPENLSKACLGCNGVPSGNGIVRIGDWVHVRKFSPV